MKLILGSMTFADQVDEAAADSMIELFLESGNREIDTAYDYCKGRTEEMLGRLLPAKAGRSIYLASKVNPWNDDGLKAPQVRLQFDEILRRLETDSIDLLYLHSPDLNTPVAETLEACAELHREGRFRDFGLSNYAAWQVAEVVELCRRNGWMEPVVYQGLYNALTRDVERELFPCLRNYGMRFYAYNPLAGGMLTGKHRSLDAAPADGRFDDNEAYQQRYWKKAYFDVIEEFNLACEQRGIAPVEAAFSWLIEHSLMDAERGDGIILGISRIEQLRANLAACARPVTLDDALLEILDRGWEIIKPNCFRYFRP